MKNLLTENVKYYLGNYRTYRPAMFDMLKEAETAGEKKSIKERLISDIKKQEYPKGITKEIVAYIKNL